MGMREELEKSLAVVSLTPADAAAVELAREYADSIDSGAVSIEDIGPKLLTLLNAIGATPSGRSRIKSGGTADVSNTPNPLHILRNSRAC